MAPTNYVAYVIHSTYYYHVDGNFLKEAKYINKLVVTRAELFKAGLRKPRISGRFEFRYESLESISVVILFVYKLMIGSSKNSTENYPRKCF